jgi:dihydroxyacid dehydratase/phosphogluconate dehydratase
MHDQELRSKGWFGRTGKDGFIYRAWMKKQGIPAHEFNKPIIGICKPGLNLPLQLAFFATWQNG